MVVVVESEPAVISGRRLVGEVRRTSRSAMRTLAIVTGREIGYGIENLRAIGSSATTVTTTIITTTATTTRVVSRVLRGLG